MAHFVLTYLGGDKPTTPEQGQQHFAKYQAWLGGLGDAAISPMNPFRNTHSVNSDGSSAVGGRSGMSGYTVIEAESMDAALAIAKACPFLEINGTLEVSELVQM
ncbi:MAG: YciI family protein [Oceanococcus sp.]